MTQDILQDPFGRTIDYLRLSVTDRCDFRCIYCMAEDMTFMPRKEVLSLEELTRLSKVFVALGVKKIRITGGEPLVRNNIISLFRNIGNIPGLEELCLTTNGSQLTRYANELVEAGVDRLNISLDTLKADRFKALTRFGELDKVLKGIEVASKAGFKRIKINAVLMQNHNVDEAIDLASFALENNLDISFIEEMPLGEITSHARDAEFISSQGLRDILSQRFTLTEDTYKTGGPSRYWLTQGYSGKVGFISPHSDNFCASCNRVRVTATGRLLLCLGNEHSVDLRSVMRQHPSPKHEMINDVYNKDIQINKDMDPILASAIINAMTIKPEKHEFDLTEPPQILRFMNTTGG